MSERSYIDGILSTHYDECSIAAADACREAGALLELYDSGSETDKKLQRMQLQLVGNFLAKGVDPLDCVPIAKATVDHPLLAMPGVQFVVARHAEFADFPPSLLAVFNNDIALPLATFQKRTDGRCSYVQIGDEIDEDELVVVPDAPRTEYVEAIRDTLKKRVPSLDLTEKSLVINLMLRQLNKYDLEVEQVLAGTVCRAAQRYIKHEGDLQSTQVYLLDEDARPTFRLKEIDYGTVIQNGKEAPLQKRVFNLFVGQELQTREKLVTQEGLFKKKRQVTGVVTEAHEVINVLAKVRGDAAVRIAQLNPEACVSDVPGVVTLGSFDEQPTRESLLALLNLFDTRTLKARRYISNIIDAFDLAQCFEHRVVVEDDRNFSGLNKGSWISKNDLQSLRERGYVYMSNGSWGGSVAYDASSWEILQEAVANYRDTRVFSVSTRLAQAIEQLGVMQKLDHFLGPVNPEAEDIIQTALGSLASQASVKKSGVLTNHTAGKTKTDVDTTVEITNGNNQVRIQVAGRPVALEGMQAVTFFDESFSLVAANQVPVEKTREIQGVLDVIFCRD